MSTNNLGGALVANGDTGTIEIPSSQKVGVFVEGTLGGGNFQLKLSQDGSTFHNFGSAISAVGVTLVEVPGGVTLKATLAGATAPNASVTITR